MKGIICSRKEFFLVGIIVFLMLMVSGCSGSGDKTDPFANNTDNTEQTDQDGIAGLTALTGLTTGIVDWINNDNPPESNWEVLTVPDMYASFSDFTPQGESVLFGGYSTFYEYVFPTTGNPNGVVNNLAAFPNSIDYYSSFAWYDGYLYTAQSSSIYRYNISGNSWTTPQSGLGYGGFSMSQSTADDNGFVYAGTDDGNHLLKYNTSLNTVQYINTPTTFPASEPRAAWDSQTQRVYLSDYEYTYLYAFNPADNSFTPLTPFPNSDGVSDAFCSDRRGHIFTTNGSGSGNEVWKYTASTDSWAQILSLPFAPGSSAVCTVSADGYLYIGDSSTNFARLKVF
jgi:hypothetical protein